MKILIIESESYLAQSIANKLGALGHECTNAASLAAAAGLAEEFDLRSGRAQKFNRL